MKGDGGVGLGREGGMRVENEQKCEEARTESLELVECGFESWLCHMLELCGTGHIISILNLRCAIFMMRIFMFTL